MSSAQKWLKIFSLLAIVGGIDLAITGVVLATSPDGVSNALTPIAWVLVVLCGLLLGVLGVRAANRPNLAIKMLPVIVIAAVANAADVVLALQTGLAVVSVVVNALIVLGIAVMAYRVNKQALDQLS